MLPGVQRSKVMRGSPRWWVVAAKTTVIGSGRQVVNAGNVPVRPTIECRRGNV